MSPLDVRRAIGGPDKPFLLESEEYFAWLSSRHPQTPQEPSESPPCSMLATFVLSWLKHFKVERMHFLDADAIYLGPGK